MVNILIHWENADWLDDKKRARTVMKFYTFTMKAFGIKNLDVITDTNIEWTDSEINFRQFKTLKEAIKLYKNKEIVVIEKSDNYPRKRFKNLSNFIHPKDNVVYLIGSDYGQINLKLLKKPVLVTIKTKNTIPLWSHTALGILMFSRFS